MSNHHVLKAFLTGVNPSTPHQVLKTFLCNNFEGVTQVKTDPRKRQGYVFVHFMNKQLLEDFLQIRTFIFQGRKLTIKPYLKGEELRKFKEELLQRRIFVKHLPFNWNDDDLEHFFTQFGKIDSAYIVFDKKTKFSRQFGYVITATKELADYIHSLRTFEVEGRTLLVRKHNSCVQQRDSPNKRNDTTRQGSSINYKENSVRVYNDSRPSENQIQWHQNSKISQIRQLMENDPEYQQFKSFKERYKNRIQPRHPKQIPNFIQKEHNSKGKFTKHNSQTQQPTIQEEDSQKEHTSFSNLLKIERNHFQTNIRFKQRRSKGHPYLDLSMYLNQLISDLSQQNRYSNQQSVFNQGQCNFNYHHNQRASQFEQKMKGSNNLW